MISVVLPTFNGSDTLPRTLDALAQLKAPRGGWQLIVVNNASTDATPEIIRYFADRLPLVFLYEPARGKSIALNRGLDRAEGDLVVLTDDDVLPDPDWLVAYRLAADAHPEIDVFNGPIKPHWEALPPAHVLQGIPILGATYGISDPALRDGPVGWELVWGANMAVRDRVVDAGNRFDPNFGPQGNRYRSGEDNEFASRLAGRGYRAWHVREAVVAHILCAHQATRSWLLRRAVALGRSVYYDRLAERPRRHLLGIPLFAARDFTRTTIGWARAEYRRDRAEIFAAEWDLAFSLGQILEGRTASARTGRHSAAPHMAALLWAGTAL